MPEDQRGGVEGTARPLPAGAEGRHLLTKAARRPAGHIIGYEHTFIHTIYDFLNAVATGKRVKPDFEDGVRNQLVLEAIERAARTRRWVTVAPL